MTVATPCRVFIGSSSEGLPIAKALSLEIEHCAEPDLWHANVFEPSGYPLDSLIGRAAKVDFAILIATPDDIMISRGQESSTARDNVILEFGLFAGTLGRERTYLLATGDLKLPSDILGLTRLPYRPRADGDLRASVRGAGALVEARVQALGKKATAQSDPSLRDMIPLDAEIERLCQNALAQGWRVLTNSATTLRLESRQGKHFTLTTSRPEITRIELREFAARLRAAGLRINNAVRRPVEQSPF